MINDTENISIINDTENIFASIFAILFGSVKIFCLFKSFIHFLSCFVGFLYTFITHSLPEIRFVKSVASIVIVSKCFFKEQMILFY